MGSSLQTHFLSYWVRKRRAFTLEQAIKKLTHDNAMAWEMKGRGLLREGYQADILLFEEDRIGPLLPTVEKDLPGGARRLVLVDILVIDDASTDNSASIGEDLARADERVSFTRHLVNARHIATYNEGLRVDRAGSSSGRGRVIFFPLRRLPCAL